MKVVVMYTKTETFEVDDRYKEIEDCDRDTEEGFWRWDKLVDELNDELITLTGTTDIGLVTDEENSEILYEN